jgi:hypothetical protein
VIGEWVGTSKISVRYVARTFVGRNPRIAIQKMVTYGAITDAEKPKTGYAYRVSVKKTRNALQTF